MNVTLEAVCGRCETWWLRWTADAEAPFDEQLPIVPEVNGRDTVRTHGLGGYRKASDGRWYRWAPGAAAALPEGETYGKYEFTCPECGPTQVRTKVGKLEDAATAELGRLHATRVPMYQTTVNKLLAWSA